MTIDECYYLGKITKPFGLKGQMTVYMDVDDINEYAELDSVFLDIKGNLVPYFLKNFTINDEHKATIEFEELTVEEAQALTGREMYLPLDLLPKLTGNQFYFHEVIGFEVEDTERGNIGTLKTIFEYPAQPLFQIMCGEKEILIPVIDQVIKQVDREHRKLVIEAPEGLIDLYLAED